MSELDDTPAESAPEKTPARRLQEELFLSFWRLLLAIAVAWGGLYAWWGLTLPQEELERIAVETLHAALQVGVIVFLGVELAYYFFVSWSFRRWRDWGLAIWAVGVVVFLLNVFNRL